MFTVFIVGTAGSGKTTLVQNFADWLVRNQYDVAIVNLDPAADYLPYVADIDVRDFISAREVMKKYKLGPNAAIIASIDLISLHIDKLKEDITSLKSTYILIDTPGQMELFAFRGIGSFIVNKLSLDRTAIVFVMDILQAQSPNGFISCMLLALSTQFKFNKAQVIALNKIDLVDKETLERILSWCENPEELVNALINEQYVSSKLEIDLSMKISELISSFGILSKPIPISAKTGEGFDELYRALHNIYIGGQDYDYVE